MILILNENAINSVKQSQANMINNDYFSFVENSNCICVKVAIIVMGI